ncbi:MAG: ComEC/Rec2 family competence protein [Chloroflexota bacterium]|nr:ComEC/Rec2 family competence protein [Chloroflexota bacterium]
MRPRLAALLLLVALLIVVASVIRAQPDRDAMPALAAGELELRALDVGQGDALLTRLDGATMLVDAGPDAPTAGADIVPRLQRLGVDRLDYLVLTHADGDHIGGAPTVMREFAVGTVVHADRDLSHPVMREVLDLARDAGVAVRRVKRGDSIAWHPQVELSVLNPPEPGPDDDNDRSVVLHLAYRTSAILLTGDIEASAERELVESGVLKSADVLKVPHHGSNSSSTAEFLDAVEPQIAVVSAGRYNAFDHPRDGALRRLRARDAAVFRTDLAGSVTVRTDGRVIQVFLERA